MWPLLLIIGVAAIGTGAMLGWRRRWVRVAFWIGWLSAAIAAIASGLAFLGAGSHVDPDAGHEAIDGVGRGLGFFEKIMTVVPGVFLLILGSVALWSAIAHRHVLRARPASALELPAAELPSGASRAGAPRARARRPRRRDRG